MMKCLAIVGSLLAYISVSHGAYCHGKPEPNAPANMFGFAEASPELIDSTTNGELYLAGPSDQQFYVIHVAGDPYEMGYAQGSLLGNIAKEFIDEVFEYLISQVPMSEIAPDLINMTIEEALDLTADLTRPFTPDYWFEEMRGLSDASGVSYQRILQLHMLPELTKGSCSMFGAWGNATLSQNGKLLQLRALDWDTEGPFKDYAAIVVYHPSNGNAFANVGFTGWIGSITGISEKEMSISEIGVSYPDSTFGKESRRGYPFPFVLRDILQFDSSVEDATKRLMETNRTCDLILGAGCGNENEFRGYEYSYSTMNAYTDYDMMPYNETWHPRINDIVYWGMDWLCPGYSSVLSQQLLAHYGNITAANAMQNIVAKTQTGNLHIAIYDYQEDRLYVSFHSKSDQETDYQMAYQRQYVMFQLSDLFATNLKV